MMEVTLGWKDFFACGSWSGMLFKGAGAFVWHMLKWARKYIVSLMPDPNCDNPF